MKEVIYMYTNDFYCLNCGQHSFELPRNKGHQHKNMHRKKLYCWHCKQVVNHIECKTINDIEIFRENFIKGVYKDEAENSLAFVRTSC